MCGMYFSLCIVSYGNDLYSIYSSFSGKHEIILYITFFFKYIYIEILADSDLGKCLKAIKCSERRVETLQIFSIIFSKTQPSILIIIR